MSNLFDLDGGQSGRMFFDGGVGIARYDRVRHPFLEKLTTQQLNFRWRPERIDIVKDGADFKTLTDVEEHIFTSNLKRQIVLDSWQGRAPAQVLLDIASQPEVENWIVEWTESETLHSRSYTHVLRNVYPKPGKVFDEITNIPEILSCIEGISKYYERLYNWNTMRRMHELNPKGNPYDEYQHKKALWLCLHAINALEGVRFYVSFACSWAFAENKKMEGNAKIIKEICRDENLHLAGTQQILKILPKEDPDFAKIKEESLDEVMEIWIDVINQEKDWAAFLFKNGSMLGLNTEVLCQYVDYIGGKRMTNVGLKYPFSKQTVNPLEWTNKWIAGHDVQVAPQEVAVDSYLESSVVLDTDENTYADIDL